MQTVKGNKTGTYQDARLLEQQGELKAAAALYGLLHKHTPKSIRILARLIIIYRKLKDTVREIKYIDAAIKIQEQYYTAGKTTNKKTIAISRQLNLLLGHTDKKGKAVFKSDDLLKLEMRKQRLVDKSGAALQKKK